MKRSISIIFSVVLLIVVLAGVGSAITATIGNAKMIVSADPGDDIRKYILVKNVNDYPVEINMEVVGDLVDWIELDEVTFDLNSGAEKKAYFTITAKESGNYQSRIQVGFKSLNEEIKGSVGFASVVILKVSGDGVDNLDEDIDLNDSVNLDGDDDTIVSNDSNDSVDVKNNYSGLLIGMMVSLTLILLLVLLLVMSKKSKLKRGHKKV